MTSANPHWKPVRLSTVSQRSLELWDKLVHSADALCLTVQRLKNGATIIDSGVRARSSVEAGRILTELAQGGLAQASIYPTEVCGIFLPEIVTETLHPAAACLDLQMGISTEGAILSGPLRLLIEPLRYVEEDVPRETAEGLCIALVEPYFPSEEAYEQISETLAAQAGIPAYDLKLVMTPSNSIAGMTQVCGRSSEDVLLTIMKSLSLDPTQALRVIGRCPISPIFKDAPGYKRLDPDDFIHYTAEAFMTWYSAPGEDVDWLCRQLCFDSIEAYGTYFGDLLEAAGGDFFKIPHISDINRLAKVTVNDLREGRLYHAGEKRPDLIEARLR